jgi:nicotinamide mononucleotide transporter
MTLIEWIAAALVLANVTLVARRSLWNYPFGLAAVSVYAVIFHDARLYSDMVLQGFFFVLNLYGALNWARARDDAGVPVGWMTTPERLGWAGAIVAGWAVWSTAMARLTDAAAPFADGAVAIASVAAQALLARRRVENWWLWIAVNAMAVPLFASRGLYVTAGVYGVLLGVAIAGLMEWRRAAKGAT